ncbi:VRR-NUC domain-containing protein [Mycena rosella]|uniref:Fanconi-associated nuclease n=1 Tax=Mycena rosella TaxID=1033263 RepID=A0AAD7DAC5_MYCRO|nr:VRR-NUC domain-containing protein [Mycena rosella]
MGGRPRTILDLIFGRDADTEERDIEEAEQSRETDPDESIDGVKAWTRQSLYIEVVERAINKIKETEGELRLFTEEEWDFLDTIARLEYHSRFILIRLIMRKPGRWHRISGLQKYTSEVGPDGLLDAFKQLCKPLRPDAMEVDEQDDGIIDLTLDSDDEDAEAPAQPVAGPSNVGQHGLDLPEVRLDYFCQDENDLSILEGLRILTLDELKPLCKTMKIKHTKLTKDEMITALVNHASSQSVLPYVPSPKSNSKGKGKARDTGLRQTTLSFAAPKISRVQTNRLRELTLKYTGKAIRLNPHIHTLIVRLHIIWFRRQVHSSSLSTLHQPTVLYSTELPDALFQHALLAGFNKRTFATYVHVRDPEIWRTREDYLAYEMALRVEAAIDEILKPEPKSERAAAKTPAPAHRFIAPGTPALDFLRDIMTPARTPGIPDAEEEALEFDVVEDTPAQQKARMVKRILDEHALEKWKALVAAESESESVRKPGLERFEPGFVYTRIMRKCAHALATLKEFVYEKELLDMLLGQRYWRRGRRAGWYDRRALLQMNYLVKDSNGSKDMNVLRDARDGIIEALEDEDTATVMRPSLIRRLDRVEKTLKLSAAEKAKHDDVTLQEPEEVFFNAVRVWDHPDSVKLDGSGKVKGKENNGSGIANYLVAPAGAPDAPDAERPAAPEPKKSVPWRWTGKSLWAGKEGPVNVETRALQYYEELGYKGFHSETQILTTLFGLLFWDIVFAQVPGAFETPWQMGPLDIGEDSFYYARRARIEKRLAELEQGQARAILEANDDRYREGKTCCIGVSWQMCGREELVEIVECLGGNALSSICWLFCEDYAGRSSGVPDLIVWNPDTHEAKFVEVKGPGDHLQENQKLWVDALLTARCAVEVCHVVDPKARKKAPKSTAKKTPKPRATPRAKSRSAGVASTSRVDAQARLDSAEPETDDELDVGTTQAPIVVDDDDDEAWTPSTELRGPLPPRAPKRRRRTLATDELPVFEPEASPEPANAPRLKKRKTI